MAVGFPTKVDYNTGDVLSAQNMNDLSGTVNLLESAQYAAGKNGVINGAMEVWQRGTSNTSPTATTAFYSADRWNFFRSVAGATLTQQLTSDTTNLPFIQYCIRVARDSGNTATNVIGLYQNFENVNSTEYIGKTITMSFYARKGANYSGDSGGTLDASVASGTGTNENQINGLTGSATVASSGVTLTTTWQRFSITGTVSSSAKQLGIKFLFFPTGTAGAADYYEITGVQLESGSTASAFQTATGTKQGELAACQRYYYRNTADVAYGAFFYGGAASSTLAYGVFNPPVSMRIQPTSLDFSNVSFSNFSGSNSPLTNLRYDSLGSNKQAIFVLGDGSAMTSGQIGSIRANNNANAFIGFNAEL
jgi:hypothetical protein